MEYTVGEAVVFGHYGATTVRAITTHEAAGRTWTRGTRAGWRAARAEGTREPRA
jgi:hypothetical protein